MAETTSSSAPLTRDQARELISRSMTGGVPTSEFNKYGGYDRVREVAGPMGMPIAHTVLSNNADNITKHGGNLAFYETPQQTLDRLKDRGVNMQPTDLFGWMGNSEAAQAAFENNYSEDQLARLAVQHDQSNANKTMDEIDWSFLVKPKPVGGYQPTSAPAVPTSQIQKYEPVTREVSPETDTVQGQLDHILDPNSPLMRRARSLAMARMAGRGLLSSSLANSSAMAAMIDKALPIAQQDAQTYFKQGLTNQDFRNKAELTNINWANDFLKSNYVTKLDFWKQSNLAAQKHAYDRDLAAQKYGFERDLAAQKHAYDRDSINVTNRWKAQLLEKEYEFKDTLARTQAAPEIQKTYIAKYQDMLKHLDSILADPDVDDAAKKAMLENYLKSVEAMNETLKATGSNLEFDFSSYYPAGSGPNAGGSSGGYGSVDLTGGKFGTVERDGVVYKPTGVVKDNGALRFDIPGLGTVYRSPVNGKFYPTKSLDAPVEDNLPDVWGVVRSAMEDKLAHGFSTLDEYVDAYKTARARYAMFYDDDF